MCSLYCICSKFLLLNNNKMPPPVSLSYAPRAEWTWKVATSVGYLASIQLKAPYMHTVLWPFLNVHDVTQTQCILVMCKMRFEVGSNQFHKSLHKQAEYPDAILETKFILVFTCIAFPHHSRIGMWTRLDFASKLYPNTGICNSHLKFGMPNTESVAGN